MRNVRISDRYEATEGTILLSGIEAIVRLFLTQRRLDVQRELSTALFVSGYEGSPLGGLDQQLGRIAPLLHEAGIVFTPGINEELAATAVGGTQLTGELPGRRYDGVVGFWYGKNPGLDRAADAIRHASVSGTSPLGGAVALVGDDPMSKSSTLPSSCEQMARSLGTPVLAPSSVQEIITLGLHAVALSRYAGLWTAVKIVADIADATATVPLVPLGALGIPAPDQTRVWHPRTLVGPGALDAEENFVAVAHPPHVRVHGNRRTEPHHQRAHPTAHRGAGLGHGLCRHRARPARPRVQRARSGRARIARGEDRYPMAPQPVRPTGDGRARPRGPGGRGQGARSVEEQLKSALYRRANQPRIYGKTDAAERPLIPGFGAVTSESVAKALARLLRDETLPPHIRHAVDQRNHPEPIRISLGEDHEPAPRTPYFCSGCPHNISTQADDDQLVGLGIGCHIMVALDDEGRGHKIGMTQMGGEGAQWIGMAPFTEDRHYAQNLGDGTFFHSGSLAVRAAVAAGVTMTYKLLYNDAVAMTGGQTPIGQVGVPELTHWLAMEGVKRVVVTTPDPDFFDGADLHPTASVIHRDGMPEALRQLAATPGVTALIHHDPCAAEERRLRNRGQRPALTESVWINSRVCEGCGDCAEHATCMSLVHVETEFGTKMSVHQGSCNLDKTCIKGECPSFVVARLRPGSAASAPAERPLPSPPTSLPAPTRQPWNGSTVIRMPGIGGTGVVSASRILQMAAHLSELHAAGIDQTGLAQRAVPVTSDVRIEAAPISGDVRASRGGADLLLGFDLLGAAGDASLSVASTERTVAVLNTAEVPTAAMLRHQGTAYPLAAGLRARIARSTRADEMVCLDAQAIAEKLTGDRSPMAANLVLVGAAFQAGHLPFGEEELAEAIRLNGVDVTASLAAVGWGRAAVADPDAVSKALESVDTGDASGVEGQAQAPAGLPADLAPDAAWPTALQDVVALRSAELVAFQNERLARRYVDHVRRVAEKERTVTGAGQLLVTEAFARGLFALMATKDEYEVARLHLLPAEQEAFARAFPGARPVYMLKPPLLASLGLKRKIKLIRTARPAFGLLRAGRHLRGTPLDVFGWSAERRGERHFLAEYLSVVDTALRGLTTESVDTVLSVVDAANRVHGYSHVRAASIAAFRDDVARSLDALSAPVSSDQRYPVAG